MKTARSLHDIRCTWVTPVLGVRGRLLYFGPLLHSLSREFAAFHVLTGEFTGDAAASPVTIDVCGSFRRLYSDDRVSPRQSGSYVSGVSVATPVVLGRLLRARPDLIIVNEFSVFCFYACLLRLLRPGTRILCIVESRPRFTDRPLIGHLRKAFRRLVTRLPHFFLTNNRSGRDYLESDLGVTPERILSQPYLISDLGGPQPRVRQWDGVRRLVFFYAGDLVKRKGVHHAIEAFGLLAAEERQHVEFRIAGDGPYRQDLEAIVAGYGLGDCVRFIGRQPFEEMRNRYDEADVFLFPTLGDYRALSTFEAMSRGAAILGSPFDGGAVETVLEGENGFVVDPTDTAAVAARIRRLVSERDLVERFSRKSIDMSQPYTLPAAVQTLRTAALRALG